MLHSRILAVALKELRHITRNLLTLFLVTVSPAFLLFTLAYVFSFDIDHANLAVMDLDKSQLARNYINRLTSGDSLSVVAFVDNYPTIERLLVAGTVDAALVIPPEFDQTIQSQSLAQVQLIVDGSNLNVAGQTISKVSAGTSAVAVKMLQPGSFEGSPPFALQGLAWYNATMKSLFSMVPGLLGVVLSLPALALSLSLTREKELGTLEGLLITPISGAEYLLGKLSAYLLMGTSSVLLSWLVAVAWFQVPFRGEMGLLILLTLAYFLASMGFSLFISTWISSQQTAMFTVMMVFFVPSFFLTGLMHPINREALGSVLVSSAFPATHYIVIARGLFLKGANLETLAWPGLILVGMGLIALLISIAAFKKNLG
jgi:ABC-2 type transport system permease protein